MYLNLEVINLNLFRIMDEIKLNSKLLLITKTLKYTIINDLFTCNNNIKYLTIQCQIFRMKQIIWAIKYIKEKKIYASFCHSNNRNDNT